MSDLKTLRALAHDADAAFQRACINWGFADQWDAYRQHDAGRPWSTHLEAAWRNMSEAFGAYYLARDGAKGFLGGKGA